MLEEENEQDQELSDEDVTLVSKTIQFPKYVWDAIVEEAADDPNGRTPEDMAIAILAEDLFEDDDMLPPVAE